MEAFSKWGKASEIRNAKGLWESLVRDSLKVNVQVRSAVRKANERSCGEG